MTETDLQWHPGFLAALEIELEDEKTALQFLSEYNLTKKPLQIDALIIKLEAGKKIRKNLGQLFRQYNIVEYKSPADYVSVNDFYKVVAYTCLFQSDTEKVLEIRPEELTMTFVCSRYPRKMVRHLKRRYQAKINAPFPGIYYLDGLIFPMQIVVNTKLSKEENFWLSRLKPGLTAKEDIEPLAKAYKGNENNPIYEAVMNLIIQANEKEYKEERRMCPALRDLFKDELEENLEKGISAVIKISRELGGSKDYIISRISQEFQLTPEAAAGYVAKFW